MISSGPSRKSALKALLNPTSDHGLGLMGIAAAFGSVAFAFVMITGDNARPFFGGAEHLELFSQPVAGGRVRAAAKTPDPGIDYEATGSIQLVKPPAPPDHIIAPPVALRGEALMLRSGAPLQGYALRGVEGGIALVDGPTGRLHLQAGMMLPGIGRVVAIERRAGQWMVVTQEGIIGEPQR